MPVIYVLHPDLDEISKVRHILNGRDYLIMDFRDIESAEKSLRVKPPDVCLLRLDDESDELNSFLEVLNNHVTCCPIVLLTDKQKIRDHIKLVGQNSIYDYFILNPVLDPLRLHMIIEKALSQSAVNLNLEDLKNRLSGLPGNIPDVFEKQANSLKHQISKSLNSFRERLKSDEFQSIIQLLDESALDDKFEQFESKEINKVIEDSQVSSSEALAHRLTAFTVHIKQQIDSPPDFTRLNELRDKLNGNQSNFTNLKEEWSSSGASDIKDVRSKASRKILFMDDEKSPTNGLVELIEKFGHKVYTAHSPRKLLDLAGSQEIDVLICGHDLGNIDGIEVVRRIREGLNKASLPVILLSSNANRALFEQCKDVGIEHIVTLPLIPKKLEEKIKALLK